MKNEKLESSIFWQETQEPICFFNFPRSNVFSTLIVTAALMKSLFSGSPSLLSQSFLTFPRIRKYTRIFIFPSFFSSFAPFYFPRDNWSKCNLRKKSVRSIRLRLLFSVVTLLFFFLNSAPYELSRSCSVFESGNEKFRRKNRTTRKPFRKFIVPTFVLLITSPIFREHR